MKSRLFGRIGILILSLASVSPAARAANWFPLGPYGGDARSFAVDSHDSKHLYLGTVTGWVYQSHDGGHTWARLSQIEGQNDLVIDHIEMDPTAPSRLMVGAFTINRPSGGIFTSEDGGRHWSRQAEMSGQSVRSLARSASNPKILVAGTLKGVYRTEDGGKHWQAISPEGSTEIHEVESLAIDPKDPQVIYIGTWHLPWKTTDGGQHWENIKKGIIDDSDVFSIIVDPQQPSTVYASACSGIYKSLDAGGEFKKIQGIPATARRTRKLAQDPKQSNVVYAGTTEGLYKSTDAGEKWIRMTPGDVIVNDVFVDPADSNHVLLATDRGGVLSSEDGATTFEASNSGFSARQVVAYAADPSNEALVYVGVVNDKQTGGVFASRDGGVQWRQMSAGLDGRDVFSLAVAPDGTVLAGTSHGIFRLQDGNWALSSDVAAAPAPAAPGKTRERHVSAQGKTVRGAAVAKKQAVVKAVAKPPAKMAAPPALGGAAVFSLVSDGNALYAGTSMGLWRSGDNGRSWAAMPAPQLTETRFVAAGQQSLLAGSLRGLALSADAGSNWAAVLPPPGLTQLSAVAIDGEGRIWIGGPEGVFYSTDHGANWQTLRNLFVREVNGIFYDAKGKRVLVTASGGTTAFGAQLPDYKVSYWDTGWRLRFLRPVGDHLIGATLFDGMVIEPKMVNSPLPAEAAASPGGKAAVSIGKAALPAKE
jgi:photosystem II stability/assembly factor-like uncharacterized protein